MRSLIFLALIILACTSTRAQDYDSRAARGLAIYKTHAFDPDSQAMLTEYITHQDHAAITVFVTPSGTRISVPNKTAEVLFVPYPGKGEATADLALLLLESASQRFPQYKEHLVALTAAWKKEAKRPKASVEAEVKRREHNEAQAEKALEQARRDQPKPKQPDSSPSPLKSPALKPLPFESAGEKGAGTTTESE